MSSHKYFSRQKDIFIVFLICALPFLFYLYRLFPKVKVWETKYFIIDSHYYESIYVLAWTAFSKLLLIGILIIWFVTCKHWWRIAILIPLSVEVYKLIVVLNDDFSWFDNFEFIKSLPFTVPIIVLLIILFFKVNKHLRLKDLISNLDKEIEATFENISLSNSINLSKYSNKFNLLKKDKDILTSKEYLRRLKALKEEIDSLNSSN